MVGTVGRNRICLATTCGLLIGGIATSRFRRYAFAAAAISGAYTAYRGHSQFKERVKTLGVTEWAKKLLQEAHRDYAISNDGTLREQYERFRTFVIDQRINPLGTEIQTIRDNPPQVNNDQVVRIVGTQTRMILLSLWNKKTRRSVNENYPLANFNPGDTWKYDLEMSKTIRELQKPKYEPVPDLNGFKQQVRGMSTAVWRLEEIGKAILGRETPTVTPWDKMVGPAAILFERDYTPSFLK